MPVSPRAGLPEAGFKVGLFWGALLFAGSRTRESEQEAREGFTFRLGFSGARGSRAHGRGRVPDRPSGSEFLTEKRPTRPTRFLNWTGIADLILYFA